MDCEFAGASGVMFLLNLIYAVVALVVGVLGILFVGRFLLKKLGIRGDACTRLHDRYSA